ncbi:Killer toxin subunits alpha/beta 6 [Colletotrichum plurivorum]|uniref:Killer toxin subunits alpha/beta 6 n=1 Tax=Colletotrichum plurivorum TaxID=2175906 RepID=A0A8H6J2U7_9PEZI|nr:Killer toxin subunits alpha/beta 6 [Colletotrichum plurivorum]
MMVFRLSKAVASVLAIVSFSLAPLCCAQAQDSSSRKYFEDLGPYSCSDGCVNVDGTCSIRHVDSGDTCVSLAAKCGIPQDTFMSYNTGSNFCDSFRIGQAVCCSSGNLPDLMPKQKPDGSCFDYVVQEDNWCDSIAAIHGLTLGELRVLNENTWGFSGCENLSAGVKLCLSKGSSPMPVPISNAVCGPQKPNMPAPSDRSPENLAKLNPCPLEACCSYWGQCGTTKEFCEAPPRGSKVGIKPGCIANCRIDVFENSEIDIQAYGNDRGAESMSAEEKEKSITKRRGLNFGGVFDRAVEVED